MVDGGGRSPSRQLNDAAHELERFLARRQQPIRILRIVLLTHPRAAPGAFETPTVDLITTSTDDIVVLTNAEPAAIRAEQLARVEKLIINIIESTNSARRGGGEARARVRKWYTGDSLASMPARHRRVRVTEDPELTRALRSAAPHLPPGLSRAGMIRELAIAGARHLSRAPGTEAKHRVLLARLAIRFEHPETAGIDWDLLRDGKQRAWPIR